jgi:hypothetical protein
METDQPRQKESQGCRGEKKNYVGVRIKHLLLQDHLNETIWHQSLRSPE